MKRRCLLLLFVLELLVLEYPTLAKSFSIPSKFCSSHFHSKGVLSSLPRTTTITATTTTTTAVPKSFLFQTLLQSSSSSTVADGTENDNDSDNAPKKRKRDQFRTLVKKYWDKLLAASLLPTLLSFGVGYRVGIKGFLKQHAKSAAKSAGDSAVSPKQSRPPIILTTVLILMISREIWRNIPMWLKRQIPIIGKKSKGKKTEVSGDGSDGGSRPDMIDNNDDLTSILTIQRKLSSVSSFITENVGDVGKDMDSAFIALLKLTSQLKDTAPELRDDRYKASGKTIDDPKAALQGLGEAFEYADWAYDELPGDKTLKDALSEKGFILLRHDKTILPGSVSHYIAMNRETKQILVGVKGTSSLEDMLTDLCGQAVTHELPGPFVPRDDSPKEIRCHEGIILAARRLADDLAPLVEDLFLPGGYKLLLVGHSLGAGVAALCGLLLRSRFPDKFVYDGHDTDDTLKVLAFASPPILDYDAALACKSFCTTIINNSDIIPRASVSNLIVTFELVRVVRKRLNELGMDPKDWKSTKAFLQMLIGRGDSTDKILSGEQFEKELEKAQSKVDLRDPDHLYCPGKVLHLFDYWSKQVYGGDKTEGDEVVIQDEEGEITEDSSDDDTAKAVVRTAESLIETDGISKVLRWIETDNRMLGDHLSPAYRSSLKALLHPEEKKTAEATVSPS